jgi:hypothetical protein
MHVAVQAEGEGGRSLHVERCPRGWRLPRRGDSDRCRGRAAQERAPIDTAAHHAAEIGGHPPVERLARNCARIGLSVCGGHSV